MSNWKYITRNVEIFIEPKLYVKRKNLPFVKEVKGSLKSAWSVKSSGEYEQDCRIGEYYAFLFLAHNQHAQQQDVVERLDLKRLLLDMPKLHAPSSPHPGPDAKGIVVGFLSTVSNYFALMPHGISPDGVSLTLNVLRKSNDKPKDDPLYAVAQCAAKRKAEAERESRELAKPANLRKLSERIKKMRTCKQSVAVSRIIDKLPEPHKTRLQDEWTERAAMVSSALFFPSLIPEELKSVRIPMKKRGVKS